ncbi:LysR family transcriptional regulator [Sutterella sp.]|uniref:LysR family transcriptional regulator n=1 Tax=Sutterella sp. TaxID=1981025 RepID=UPI0026E0206B|nr:LysR family transcriptional regulator [Sutterella sp.]MDO5532409.1 LysR family transcriptional regulator [Sutterella sp.]
MQKTSSIETRALAFFLALFESRSLAETAERFAMSSATAQRTLEKLREHFGGDRLFTREGFAMRPTPKAERIAGQLRPLLAALDRLGVDNDRDFFLRKEKLRIAAYDNACTSIFAPIFPKLIARAPKLTLEFLQSDERMFFELADGTIDFVIFARQGLGGEFRSMPLLTTPYTWVVRKGHRLEKIAEKQGFVTPQDAELYPQVIANAQPDRRRSPNGPAEGWFHARRGGHRALEIPFFLAAPCFIEGSDLVLVMPRALARTALGASPERFSLLPTPPDAPTLTMNLAWHERKDADPYFQWFRGVLKMLLRDHPENPAREEKKEAREKEGA